MRDCTCAGSCRGAEGLGPGWNCVVENGPRESVYPTAIHYEQDTARELLAEHSVALEFIRELASTPCAWGCIADHPDEQPCIHCRAATWLHSESGGAQALGSRVVSVGPVSIGCMAKDSRDALDLAMERWRTQQARIPPADDPVYQFAYWLLRWSGIVTGVNLHAPEHPWAEPSSADAVDPHVPDPGTPAPRDPAV